MATFNVTTVEELVDAINDANLNSEADIINLAQGLYDLSEYDSQTRDSKFVTPGMTEINGLPLIQTDITIAAPSNNPDLTVIARSGSQLYRLLFVTQQGTLTLKNFTLRDGNVSGFPDHGGGGVYNKGTLSIINCKLGPSNRGNYGGAVRNDGITTIENSEIFENRAHNGGGVYNEGTSITISNSLLRNNDGPNGGAVLNSKSTAVMTIEECLVKSNTGVYGAGVASYAGEITVTKSILTENLSNGSALYTRGSGEIVAHNNCIFDNAVGENVYVVLNDDAIEDIDARFNWWGNPSGPQPGQVSASVDTSNFSEFPYCYCEALYPIFGKGRRSDPNDPNTFVPDSAFAPALYGYNWDENTPEGVHKAIDIVPLGLFANGTPDPDWDQDSANAIFKEVYAVVTGLYLEFPRGNGSCCDALIRPESGAYYGMELVYIHFKPNGITSGSTVTAGTKIGEILYYGDDQPYAGEQTHLHFSIRKADPPYQQSDYMDPRPCMTPDFVENP